MSQEKTDAFFRALYLRLPTFWTPMGECPGGIRFEHTLVQMRVIMSAEEAPDRCAWIHFSMSRKDRIPNWDELKAAKEIFLGDVLAIQLLPPKAEYVNIHPHCLHLWHNMDRNPLPDFRRNGRI